MHSVCADLVVLGEGGGRVMGSKSAFNPSWVVGKVDARPTTTIQFDSKKIIFLGFELHHLMKAQNIAEFIQLANFSETEP